MAYDRELAERIRDMLAHLPVEEKSMFGGLSFMVNDKMAITANTHGDLMVRCDPDRVDELLDHDAAEWAQMGDRQMSKGWLRIAQNGYESDEKLQFWLDAALEFNEKATGE